MGLAAAPLDGQIYLFGGSAGANFNATVYAFDPVQGRVRAVGRLPAALHDGGAAAGPGEVLFCGGGQSAGSAAIYRFAPAGLVAQAGDLPRPLSDLEGVTVGGEPYCLGGWTGSLYSDQVYAVGTLTGGQPTLVAHLPHAVRYGAAAALPGGVLVAGGQVSTGQPTAAIQWVPLGAGATAPAVIGDLPEPLAYAMAATLGDAALVLGGCDATGHPVASVQAVSAQGLVTAVGSLPEALCDGAAASIGPSVYVFGGQLASGAPSAEVWRVAATSGPATG